MARRKTRRKRFTHKITYYDPKDETGQRIITWKFQNLRSAKEFKKDLMAVWKIPSKEIKIRRIR